MSIKAPKERDTQKALVAYLELRGCVVIRCNSGAVKVGDRFIRFNSAPGCSDLLICLPGGRFAACEIKTARGRLTAKQAGFLDRVRAAGGIGAVVRSVADADRLLAEATVHPGVGGGGR